jgi:recombination associated protein RdgC
MWFKNLIIYRIPQHWDLDLGTVADALLPHAFAPASATEETRIGWAPPREDDPSLAVCIDRQILITLRTEKRLLPSKVVTQFVRHEAARIEEEEGMKVGRKRLKALKEQIREQLLPRAFAIASDTRVWIDPVQGWLAVDTGSGTRAHEVFSLLAQAFRGFPGRVLEVRAAPAGEMTAWLMSGEAPSGFTVDQDVELKARDGKASVRYANQSLEHDDVTRHTQAGKQCTRLALTWKDRIAFVLTDKLEIKRIKPLDVIKEAAAGSTAGADANERFLSDMTMMTGELSALLTDLVWALGGEAPARSAAADAVASASAASIVTTAQAPGRVTVRSEAPPPWVDLHAAAEG